MNYLKRLNLIQIISTLFFILITVSIIMLILFYNKEPHYDNIDILIVKIVNSAILFYLGKYMYSFIRKVNLLKKRYLLMNTKEREREERKQLLFKDSLLYYKKIRRQFIIYIFIIVPTIVYSIFNLFDESLGRRYGNEFNLFIIIGSFLELILLVYYLTIKNNIK